MQFRTTRTRRVTKPKTSLNIKTRTRTKTHNKTTTRLMPKTRLSIKNSSKASWRSTLKVRCEKSSKTTIRPPKRRTARSMMRYDFPLMNFGLFFLTHLVLG